MVRGTDGTGAMIPGTRMNIMGTNSPGRDMVRITGRNIAEKNLRLNRNSGRNRSTGTNTLHGREHLNGPEQSGEADEGTQRVYK